MDCLSSATLNVVSGVKKIMLESKFRMFVYFYQKMIPVSFEPSHHLH